MNKSTIYNYAQNADMAKTHSAIAVDEIIDSNPNDNPMTHHIDSTEYWYQVKQEIQKL